eukprot:m.24328 g.24328  ORF g.24328 m.24328 type:complete len:765 (+) comp14556_c0_seq1:110-2404(+)
MASTLAQRCFSTARLAWARNAACSQRNLSLTPRVRAAAPTISVPNFSYSITDSGVAIITYDRQDNKVNALNMVVGDELIAMHTKLNNDPAVRAMVLMSGKPNDFIAGADINLFEEMKSEEEMLTIPTRSQKMFDQLENGKPIVAAIHGNCLGGGLETALACHYRVATESPRTKIGLPECQLGLLPGGGGTQRLPKLVGLEGALPLLLTGQQIRPSKAKRLKLVDVVADPFALQHAAVQAAEGLANGTLKPDRGPKGFVNKLKKFIIEDTKFGRDFVFKTATKGVMKQTHGNYPAQLKILDVLKQSMEVGLASPQAYAIEAAGFAKLGMSPESRALRGVVFFGMTAAKKNPYPKSDTKVKNISVIGAGLMGAGVAQVSVVKDYDVTLVDAMEKGLARGMTQIEKNLNTKVKKRQMTTFEADSTLMNVTGVVAGTPEWKAELGKSDMVIEAVFEDLDLKYKVFKQLEEVIPENCVLASNTSAIPIGTLALGCSRPQNFIGMHYFSPVDKMPLLEIIPHAGTSEKVCSLAYEVGLKQGKTPIVVKDVPGFFVNRCLGPYVDEALALVQSGADVKELNEAMVKYGFPVGPMSLADEVGIDVAAHLPKNLEGDLGIRVGASDLSMLDKMVEANMLGRKTGKGMFLYEPGTRGGKEINPAMLEIVKPFLTEGAEPISRDDIQMRMMSRFVNEAAYCLQDEIIANPTSGDVGSCFGIGFPFFMGGPFRMLDEMGVQNFVDVLHKYQAAHGDHFKPAPILLDYAKSGKKFYN